jgi:hypothetical protein
VITKEAIVGSRAALVRFEEGEVRNHVYCSLTRNLDPPTRPDPQLLGGPFHIDIRTDPNGGFQDALDTGAYGAIEGEGFVRRHDR